MPRSFPQYTKCAAPGDAYKFLDSWLGVSIWSLVFAGLAGGGFWLLAFIMAKVAGPGCIYGIATLALLLAGLHQFLHWYYNNRLMCIKKDECYAGTLTGDPLASLGLFGDGDQKYDTLVAPFPPREMQGYFAEVIQENPAQFGAGPANFADPIALQNYVEAMSGSLQIRLYMRVVREKMFTQAGRDFLKRFLIRIESEMGTPAFNDSLDDTFASPNPTPVFRISPADSLAPYFHCELEGDRLKKWMTNLLIGLWTAFVAYTTLCAICVYFTGQEWACSGIAKVGALLLGFLAWLISRFFNDPDEGAAQQTDVGFADPAYDGDKSSIRQGDVMLIFGDWIKDVQHEKYFEIHPIKALYLICHSGTGSWEVVNDLTGFPRDRCPYSVENITSEDMVSMCEFVKEGEKTEPMILKTLTTADALSMAAGIRIK